MRSIYSCVCLLILATNGAGVYVYFASRLYEIRREMRLMLRTLPDEALTRLDLTIEQYESGRIHEEELKIDGRMYDIARIVFRGDSVIVFGLHDPKEDNLLAWLDEVLMRLQGDEDPLPSSLLGFILQTYIPPQTISLISPDHDDVTSFTPFIWFLYPVEPEHSSPPPRILLHAAA